MAKKELLRACEIARLLNIRPNVLAMRIKRRGYKPKEILHNIPLYDFSQMDFTRKRKKK